MPIKDYSLVAQYDNLLNKLESLVIFLNPKDDAP